MDVSGAGVRVQQNVPSPASLSPFLDWLTLMICMRSSSILVRLSCNICWAMDSIFLSWTGEDQTQWTGGQLILQKDHLVLMTLTIPE